MAVAHGFPFSWKGTRSIKCLCVGIFMKSIRTSTIQAKSFKFRCMLFHNWLTTDPWIRSIDRLSFTAPFTKPPASLLPFFAWSNSWGMETCLLAVNGSHRQERFLESVLCGSMQSGGFVNRAVRLWATVLGMWTMSSLHLLLASEFRNSWFSLSRKFYLPELQKLRQ